LAHHHTQEGSDCEGNDDDEVKFQAITQDPARESSTTYIVTPNPSKLIVNGGDDEMENDDDETNLQ